MVTVSARLFESAIHFESSSELHRVTTYSLTVAVSVAMYESAINVSLSGRNFIQSDTLATQLYILCIVDMRHHASWKLYMCGVAYELELYDISSVILFTNE
eukprot:scaffold94635_cov26-Prasinocladus_malaysianus.AAC.1